MINDSNKHYKFVFTQDGSTGLYNYDADDIYHSIFGAKEEAEAKFVRPLNLKKFFIKKQEIKVLDICYGIGYNTKALLKKLIQIKYKGKIKIDLLEYDKELVLASPFIKDGFFKQYPQISFMLFNALFDEISNDSNLVSGILCDKNNRKFLEPFYRVFIKRFLFGRYVYIPEHILEAFLHNIYYHCISQRNKRPVKCFRNNDFVLTPYFDDARNTIKRLTGEYDIIFLDAFTPSKLPTLWSLEFFMELYRLSSFDCILVTYSNSAAVRHAMLDSGYYVGKLFDKDKRHCGTIASKNPDLIENKLDGYDIGLINTAAGVYYRDKDLCCSAEEILKEHEKRKKYLNLESSSRYIKRNKKEQTHACV